MHLSPVHYSGLLGQLMYLDPGSGSIIIQMLVAALLGGGILLRSFWNKIFKKGKDTSTDEDDDDQPGEKH